MSLSSHLSNSNKGVLLCKLARLISSDLISSEDKQAINLILSTPLEDPRRVTNTALAKILRQEGFDISSRTIDRHKNEECSCYRKIIK